MSAMPPTEQVLVLPRDVFDRAGAFQGLAFDTHRYLEAIFAPGVLAFMPRPAAENDPGFKQVIPYVIMAHQGRYLSYVRGKKAGEQRLVGNRSIGIGGHINPTDELPLFNVDFRDVYRAAVEREVAEEVVVDTPHSDRIVALLNDDSTEVGRVHLGIVHYWDLARPDVRKREQVITQFAFMTAAELQAAADTLESWSRMCLDHLDRLENDKTS
jgi:predicted NUDIX family phosphoesterase